MTKALVRFVTAVLLFFPAVPAHADLIGVSVGLPDTLFDSNGTTTYDATTREFKVKATPITITFPGSPFPTLKFVTGLDRALSIEILVDNTGRVFSGVAGHDFKMVGTVDNPSGGQFTGTLLTGEIILPLDPEFPTGGFGFAESGGPTDLFDFAFEVTGGSMAAAYGGVGNRFGVSLTVEHSNFESPSLFTKNFEGGAKGDVGPIGPCRIGNTVWLDVSKDGELDLEDRDGLQCKRDAVLAPDGTRVPNPLSPYDCLCKEGLDPATTDCDKEGNWQSNLCRPENTTFPGDPKCEPVLPDFVVNLREKVSGLVVASTVTDSEGYYYFDVECGVEYVVEVEYPSSVQPTQIHVPPPSADSDDPDGQPLTPTTPEDFTFDFGFIEVGGIGNWVWHDQNGNGCGKPPSTGPSSAVNPVCPDPNPLTHAEDLAEVGIDNVKVTLYISSFGGTWKLYKPTTSYVNPQVTGGGGFYFFGDLETGPDHKYKVCTQSLLGYDRTFPLKFGPKTICHESRPNPVYPLKRNLSVDPFENYLDADFGFQKMACVGDRVWNDINGDGVQDVGEAGFDGWAVKLYLNGSLLKTTSTTNALVSQGYPDGYYKFEGLKGGSYRVCVTPPSGYIQTWDPDWGPPPIVPGTPDPGPAPPHCYAFSLANGQCTDSRLEPPDWNLQTPENQVDFGYQFLIDPGDRVWDDVDGDGVQDPGERGINGVTLTLYRGKYGSTDVVATDVTKGDGHYAFTSLRSDFYTVCVTPPEGYNQTWDLDGKYETPHCTTVWVDRYRDDVDFGYQQTSTLGDKVFQDLDGSRSQGKFEPGLAHVTVTLQPRGSTSVFSTVSDETGTYEFSGLRAGTYKACVVAPEGYRVTRPTTGCSTTVLKAGQKKLTIDFGLQPNQ